MITQLMSERLRKLEIELNYLRALEQRTGFVDLSSAQTVGGIKTFTSIPILPASDPTLDNQAVRKAYIDSEISSALEALMIVPTAKVYHDTSQKIPHNSTTTLVFNSEYYDNDDIHDTSTNNSRLTCKTAGLYGIFACWKMTDSATGDRIINIVKNGTKALVRKRVRAASGGTTILPIYTEEPMAVDDYVEVTAYQDSGGNENVVYDPDFSPVFGMTWKGKVS